MRLLQENVYSEIKVIHRRKFSEQLQRLHHEAQRPKFPARFSVGCGDSVGRFDWIVVLDTGIGMSDKEDAQMFRWLLQKSYIEDRDGGNSGSWQFPHIPAYDNYIGNKYDHSTFRGAVRAAMKREKS